MNSRTTIKVLAIVGLAELLGIGWLLWQRRERPIDLLSIASLASSPSLRNAVGRTSALVSSQIEGAASQTALVQRNVALETELTEEEYRVFLQSRHDKSRWDVARLGWNADFNDASNFLDVLRSHSTNNDMGYSNPAYDALLDQAAGMIDVQKRKETLEAAERLMLNDYPIIPLYYFVSKRLVKPYVQGFKPNPLGQVPSKTLTLAAH